MISTTTASATLTLALNLFVRSQAAFVSSLSHSHCCSKTKPFSTRSTPMVTDSYSHLTKSSTLNKNTPSVMLPNDNMDSYWSVSDLLAIGMEQEEEVWLDGSNRESSLIFRDDEGMDQECSTGEDAISARCKLQIQELRNLLSMTRQALELIDVKMDAINTLQKQQKKTEENSLVSTTSAAQHRAELVTALADAREADMKFGLCSEPSNRAWAKVDALYVHHKQVEEEEKEMNKIGDVGNGCIAVPQQLVNKMRKLRSHYIDAINELEGNVLDLEHKIIKP